MLAPRMQGTMTDSASPRRPLTVVQLVPALENGGAERSTLEIGRALVDAGYRSVVISRGGRLVERLREEGSEHLELDIGAKSLKTLTRIGKLRRTLAALGPDIVHARSRVPAWAAWLALRRMRPRPHFVTTVHGLNTPGAWSRIMTRGERVIVVSQTVRDFVLSHYRDVDPAKLTVIPRGIDPAEFPYGYRPDDPWRRRFFGEFPQLAGAPLLTLPGRGTRLKGHADAIALLAGLRARGLEAYLAELRALARDRGVHELVVFSPPRNDVRDVYAASELILQLSNKPESFGRTVLEALSLCRPVLGYAHGGVGELLAELYPAGREPPADIEKLTERAAELLSRAPPIAPLHRYRLADMQAQTLELYRELAAAPRAVRRLRCAFRSGAVSDLHARHAAHEGVCDPALAAAADLAGDLPAAVRTRLRAGRAAVHAGRRVPVRARSACAGRPSGRAAVAVAVGRVPPGRADFRAGGGRSRAHLEHGRGADPVRAVRPLRVLRGAARSTLGRAGRSDRRDRRAVGAGCVGAGADRIQSGRSRRGAAHLRHLRRERFEPGTGAGLAGAVRAVGCAAAVRPRGPDRRDAVPAGSDPAGGLARGVDHLRPGAAGVFLVGRAQAHAFSCLGGGGLRGRGACNRRRVEDLVAFRRTDGPHPGRAARHRARARLRQQRPCGHLARVGADDRGTSAEWRGRARLPLRVSALRGAGGSFSDRGSLRPGRGRLPSAPDRAGNPVRYGRDRAGAVAGRCGAGAARMARGRCGRARAGVSGHGGAGGHGVSPEHPLRVLFGVVGVVFLVAAGAVVCRAVRGRAGRCAADHAACTDTKGMKHGFQSPWKF